MNIAMWARAVNVIPRVSQEQWSELDVIAKWLIATRSAVLIMTFNSAAIAGLLAARDGAFDLSLWSLVVIGLLFAHATNNLINDYTDHVKGVDKDNYFRSQYGPQPLEHGLMTKNQMLTYIAVTGLIAFGRRNSARLYAGASNAYSPRDRCLFRALLHLALEVHRLRGSCRASRVGSVDGRWRLLRHYRSRFE